MDWRYILSIYIHLIVVGSVLATGRHTGICTGDRTGQISTGRPKNQSDIDRTRFDPVPVRPAGRRLWR